MKRNTLLVLFFSLVFVATVIVLALTFTRIHKIEHPEFHGPFWQKEVVYQIYPRSFKDSDADGIGDLKGIESKVDYLKRLGIGIVWISPIYESPMADFGYDISNFVAIDPIFGTIDDFDDMIKAYHNKGLKIVMDFVPNHSSNEHDWFRKSEAKEGNYTDYYIWNDGVMVDGTRMPPNNWLSVFGNSSWEWSPVRQQYYYHAFLVEQPDLNYRNPLVKEEMKNALRFWLDKGVDGFRIDAVKFLFEVEPVEGMDEPVDTSSGVTDPNQYEYLNHTYTVNLDEIYVVLREWREVIEEYNDNKVLMAEVYDNDINQIMKYYGNETDILADFPFNFLMTENIRNRTEVTGHILKYLIDKWIDNMPEGKWANWVFGNHDNGRVSSRLGRDLLDAVNMINLLLPGTAVTYYGEEIGMEDTFISYEDTQDPFGCNYGPDRYMEFSRDPERTPMQWDNTTNAGFSEGNDTWIPVNENYVTLNVVLQENEDGSPLEVYKELTKLRQKVTFLLGELGFPLVTEEIFSFLRYLDNEPSYLYVLNIAQEERIINMHQQANMVLPSEAKVILRSSTDNREETEKYNVLDLSELPMLGGEGLLLELIEDEIEEEEKGQEKEEEEEEEEEGNN